jgi:hypothetical protein
VGYVVLDGHPDPVRARSAWVSDNDIAAMAQRYSARRGDVIDTSVVDDTAVPARVVEVQARDEAAA